jgi:ribonuclease P protein component
MVEPREFSRARAEGRRAVLGCLIANWIPLDAAVTSKLGVVTSRKIGPSVTRNRARRLLRESFRIHQHEIKRPISLVLVARASIARMDFHGVERDLLTVLKREKLLEP